MTRGLAVAADFTGRILRLPARLLRSLLVVLPALGASARRLRGAGECVQAVMKICSRGGSVARRSGVRVIGFGPAVAAGRLVAGAPPPGAGAPRPAGPRRG